MAAATTHDRALRWLVESVPERQWRAVRDSLVRDRVIPADAPEQMSEWNAMQALTFMYGDPAVDSTDRTEFSGPDAVLIVQRLEMLHSDGVRDVDKL